MFYLFISGLPLIFTLNCETLLSYDGFIGFSGCECHTLLRVERRNYFFLVLERVIEKVLRLSVNELLCYQNMCFYSFHDSLKINLSFALSSKLDTPCVLHGRYQSRVLTVSLLLHILWYRNM